MAEISVQEAEQTRQHTAAQIGRLERLHVDDRRFEEVTRSLFYPEIFLWRTTADITTKPNHQINFYKFQQIFTLIPLILY